jgi:hypothetical protein
MRSRTDQERVRTRCATRHARRRVIHRNDRCSCLGSLRQDVCQADAPLGVARLIYGLAGSTERVPVWWPASSTKRFEALAGFRFDSDPLRSQQAVRKTSMPHTRSQCNGKPACRHALTRSQLHHTSQEFAKVIHSHISHRADRVAREVAIRTTARVAAAPKRYASACRYRLLPQSRQ